MSLLASCLSCLQIQHYWVIGLELCFAMQTVVHHFIRFATTSGADQRPTAILIRLAKLARKGLAWAWVSLIAASILRWSARCLLLRLGFDWFAVWWNCGWNTLYVAWNFNQYSNDVLLYCVCGNHILTHLYEYGKKLDYDCIVESELLSPALEMELTNIGYNAYIVRGQHMVPYGTYHRKSDI